MRRAAAAVLFASLAALVGCHAAPRGACQTDGRLPISALTDFAPADDTVPVIDVALCEALAQKMGRPFPDSAASHATDPKPAVVPAAAAAGPPPPRRFNILALSGGGAYGAYSAGVMVGWTESGTRPTFDVVTGVSTGSLVATLAFLGPARDPDLKRFYTTVTNKDIYSTKSPEAIGLFGESLADSAPLERLINATVDERLMAEVAAEHAKGRRLYVGSTHLDSRRLVVWDMGAIASRGGGAYLTLFRKVLLASASIPGFFPPVRVPVVVDGRAYEEIHVDGGVTAALFFRPPQVTADERAALGDMPLAGSNLYMVVAGKLYAEPGCSERSFVKIAADSLAALTYAQARGDLFQLFALCLAARMNYHLTAIPQDAAGPPDATTFDPAALAALFEVGRAQGAGSKWRSAPPGLAAGEQVPVRSTTFLTTNPNRTPEPPGGAVVPAGGTAK